MDDYLVRPLAAALAAAAVAGPLGCFVVWHRLAYFGETVAHAGLLGVALALVLDVDLALGVGAIAILTSAAIIGLERVPGLATDTLLGITATTALALGVIVVSSLSGVRVDVTSYLFGDVLAVAPHEVWTLVGVAIVCLGGLGVLWRPLLVLTTQPDIARVEGVPVERLRPLLVVMLAVVIAAAMKIVGILMVIALLIIPAATARRLSSTPEAMAILAALLGGVAVLGGMAGAVRWDLPPGPAMVVASFVLFVAVGGLGRVSRALSASR